MVRRRFFGIFGKVFLYTMVILLFVIGSMFFIFSSQIQSTIALTQQQQFSETLARLVAQTRGETPEGITALVEDFHRWNASFELSLSGQGGAVLFQTDGFGSNAGVNELPSGALHIVSGEMSELSAQRVYFSQQIAFLPLGNGLHLRAYGSNSGASIYREIVGGAVWIFGIITLVSLLAAFLFARLIAGPIQRVSADTHMMSQLLPVDAPKARSDEIGQLSVDVYDMYNRLKSTIHQLETEIERVKQMEESRRYFFSAASHELKTPITAVGGIFEGMLNDVITPEEYPVYLREGIKLVNEQSKLVSEILELVKLGGELPALEKEPINLRRCLDGVISQLTGYIESKGQQLAVHVEDSITCELDDRLFSKVLSNVLLNAAQNSPEFAEIRVAATMNKSTPSTSGGYEQQPFTMVGCCSPLGAHEKPGGVCLTVWNGCAEIPANIISNVYEPFYRADQARTSCEGRSGLGLAIVKKALDLMGIDYEIRNADGGVLFEMDIPVE